MIAKLFIYLLQGVIMEIELKSLYSLSIKDICPDPGGKGIAITYSDNKSVFVPYSLLLEGYLVDIISEYFGFSIYIQECLPEVPSQEYWNLCRDVYSWSAKSQCKDFLSNANEVIDTFEGILTSNNIQFVNIHTKMINGHFAIFVEHLLMMSLQHLTFQSSIGPIILNNVERFYD